MGGVIIGAAAGMLLGGLSFFYYGLGIVTLILESMLLEVLLLKEVP